MGRNWVIHPKAGTVSALSRDLGIHPEVASLLVRRGFSTPAEIFNFLNPSLESLESPFAFRDMQKAADRIRQAVIRREKILVYGDYDVDGITGSAILYPVLKKMGADVQAYIPHRMNEGYGLNQASLERLLEKGFGLVITVDNGITGVEPIRFLAQKGVDVIVVDHHLPKNSFPPAFAIVSACAGERGDSHLAACGLAFKLAWALLGSFKAAEEYLDLVVVGTVADLAAVTGENRALLKHGLPLVSQTKRPGLRALIDAAKLPRNLGYRDIAFGLGPRINAAGRMGSPENAFRLLTTGDSVEARELAQLLDSGNRDRQRVETEAFEEALERVEEEFLSEEEKVLVLENPGWHEGVLGIVAARLVERFHKPSVVIALKNGVGKGSGRSTPHFSLFDSVLTCEELLINFGGHAQACGLTIKDENIPLFRKKLNEVVRQKTPPGAASHLAIDAELALTELDLRFLRDLEKLAPFGPGNPKPLFVSKRLRLRNEPRKRGKDTLQCWVMDEEGKTTCEAVGFRMYSRWMASKNAAFYDVVYQPTLSDFNGIVSIKLELEDWRASSRCASGLS